MSKRIRTIYYSLGKDSRNNIDNIREALSETLMKIPGTSARMETVIERKNKMGPFLGYSIVVRLEWESNGDFLFYLKHKLHLKWCRFILYGWRIKGDRNNSYKEQLDRLIIAVLDKGSRPVFEKIMPPEGADSLNPFPGDESTHLWQGEFVVDSSLL